MATAWVPFGRVLRVNPARRELRIEVQPGRARTDEELEWVQTVLRDGSELKCRVEQIRLGDGTAVMNLAPGVTRDNVARMKGATLNVLADAHARRNDGDYTVEELKGLRVVNETGDELGVVETIYATDANAALEIVRSDGTGFLVPAIPQVIERIDWERNEIVVGDIAPYVVNDEG